MATLNELLEKKRSIESQIENNDSILKTKMSSSDRLNAEIEPEKQRMNSLFDSLEARRAQLLKRLERLDEEDKQAMQTRDQLISENDELKGAQAAFNTRRDRYNADIGEVNRKVKHYNEIRNDSSYSQNYKNNLKREITEMGERLRPEGQEIKAEAKRLNDRFARLESRIQSLKDRKQSINTRYEQLGEEITSQTQDYERAKSEKQRLLSKIEGFERLTQEISQLKGTLSRLKSDLSNVEQQIQRLRAEKKYIIKDNTVHLSPLVIEVIAEIAETYFAKVNKKLVITDGTRTAHMQASALYYKLNKGDDVVRLYRNKKLIKEIKESYDNNKDKPQSEVVEIMRAVIQAQIDGGEFISKHLRSGAFDIRSRDMSGPEKQAFREAVAMNSNLVLIEEGTPPHFHIHFKTIPVNEHVANFQPAFFAHRDRDLEEASVSLAETGPSLLGLRMHSKL